MRAIEVYDSVLKYNLLGTSHIFIFLSIFQCHLNSVQTTGSLINKTS